MSDQSIRLHTVTCMEDILGCSITTCDEPLLADLDLKTLRNRRDFHKLMWYCKVMSMKDKRLSFKSLTNEWNKVRCKGHLRRSWLAQVEFLSKELCSQDQVLDLMKIVREI